MLENDNSAALLKARKQLGLYLKEQRESSGMTQARVSEHLGYESGQFLSNIERGACSPPFEILPKLGEIYSIEPAKLLAKFQEIIHEYYNEKWDLLTKDQNAC